MATDGLVVVDKPAAWTSHDVVARLRSVFGQRRVGHAGTLDPDATGVLVVGLGRATRLLRYLQGADKEYRGTVVFGVATDTLDAAGTVTERTAMPLERSEVERAAATFAGEIAQVPPMVSALKVGGRRLHELARAGQEVEREARMVRIDRIEVEDFVPGPFPQATLLVACSSGTYVRTLAADLGAALGGPAHLGTLRRLRVGAFTLADAHPLAEIEARTGDLVLPPAAAVRGLDLAVVDDGTARAVFHGAMLSAEVLGSGAGPCCVTDARGRLLAVYERRGAGWKPTVVVAEEAGT